MVTSRRDAGSEPDGTAGLIRRARNGDRDAFDWLASFHQDCLQRFVSRKVSDPEDVADLCQEILVHAYLKLNSFQGRSGFGTWLLSIAKRAIAEYYRSNHAATIIEQYRGTRGSIVRDNALRSYGEAMEESCDIRQQIEDRLACVITVLSLEEQLAVILCDFYGFTDNESSTIMAKSLGAFKHLLHRARVMMDLRCDCNRVLIRKSNLSKRTLCGDARCNLPVTFVTHSEAASQGNGAKLSNSFLLSLRAELLREIDSLIHSDPSRSFGRWPLHVSPKPISKIVPRRHPTFEKR